MRRILVFGATGLIGRAAIEILLREPGHHWTEIRAAVRRPLGIQDPRLVEILVDWDHLEQVKDQLVAEDVFSALGTTIKKAGSQEAFRKVDYDYALASARIAAENGAEKLALVTALGADARSRIFYNRVKGELETAISELPYRAIHIGRPSILLGDRGESRPMERLGQSAVAALGPLMRGPLARYRAIHGQTVARALLRALAAPSAGRQVHESEALAELGQAPFTS
ncbi:MAG: NAD(P)H-binding protein [Myxococcota bacterium]